MGEESRGVSSEYRLERCREVALCNCIAEPTPTGTAPFSLSRHQSKLYFSGIL